MRRLSLIKLVVLLISFTCVTSCEKSESERFVKIKYEKFDHLIYNRTFTFKHLFNDLFEQYEEFHKDFVGYLGFPKEALEMLQILYTINMKYEVSAIAYHTVAPNGQPILASGVIYYPKTFSPKGVVEISPINESKKNCGTEKYEKVEALPGIIAGYICILPDLIGYGCSASLPINYMQLKNTTIVSADMRKAAEEFIYNHYHHSLGKESILFGYSLGAAYTMALAREYQLNPSHGIIVRHIFAGGGVYEPLLAFKAQLAIDRSDYAILPNILLSMNYYDNLNLDFNKIFKGELLENYQTWCNGDISIIELTKKLGTKLSNYFSNTFIEGYDTLEEYRPLVNALDEKKLPLDWVPQAKVHLSHSSQDYYVPTVCSDSLYEYLKNVGADVNYVKYDASHTECALLFGIDFTKFLLNQ